MRPPLQLLAWLIVLVAATAGATPPAEVINRTRLSYAPGLNEEQRLADLLAQTRRALAMMGLAELGDIRERALRDAGRRFSWEQLPREVVTELIVRVWVPRNARRVRAFGGSDAQWKRARKRHTNLPRAAGDLWFSERLADINDRARYREATLSFQTHRLHAPVAALLLDHAFREGRHDVKRRLPIMVVRSGEDCYSADRSGGPVHAEAASFTRGLRHTVSRGQYRSLGEILQGCHVRRSAHRIGCALDVNFFWLYRSRDGSANAITSSRRHARRDRMHAVDARNLPLWFYRAAKAMGYRVPQDWTYAGGKDWPHLDIR